MQSKVSMRRSSTDHSRYAMDMHGAAIAAPVALFVNFRAGSLALICSTLPRDVGASTTPIGMEGPILVQDRIACSAVDLAQDRVPKLTLGFQKGIEKGMPVVVGSPRTAGLMAKQVGIRIKLSANLGAKTIEPPAQRKPSGGRVGNDHIRSTRLRGFCLGK